jgi:hypothetical protein
MRRRLKSKLVSFAEYGVLLDGGGSRKIVEAAVSWESKEVVNISTLPHRAVVDASKSSAAAEETRIATKSIRWLKDSGSVILVLLIVWKETQSAGPAGGTKVTRATEPTNTAQSARQQMIASHSTGGQVTQSIACKERGTNAGWADTAGGTSSLSAAPNSGSRKTAESKPSTNTAETGCGASATTITARSSNILMFSASHGGNNAS